MSEEFVEIDRNYDFAPHLRTKLSAFGVNDFDVGAFGYLCYHLKYPDHFAPRDLPSRQAVERLQKAVKELVDAFKAVELHAKAPSSKSGRVNAAAAFYRDLGDQRPIVDAVAVLCRSLNYSLDVGQPTIKGRPVLYVYNEYLYAMIAMARKSNIGISQFLDAVFACEEFLSSEWRSPSRDACADRFTEFCGKRLSDYDEPLPEWIHSIRGEGEI